MEKQARRRAGFLVPRALVRLLPSLTDEALRVLLFLYFWESDASHVGVAVNRVELAEKAGLHPERAVNGLIGLQLAEFVEEHPEGSDCWRLARPAPG